MGTHELKLEPKKEEKEECIHIAANDKIIDSGMSFYRGNRRDLGLGCEDCGLEWDVHLYPGSSKATIRLRQPGTEEYNSDVELLSSFFAYLKRHKMAVCYYDDGRRKRRDDAVKGYYPIALDDDYSVKTSIDMFLEEIKRCT